MDYGLVLKQLHCNIIRLRSWCSFHMLIPGDTFAWFRQLNLNQIMFQQNSSFPEIRLLEGERKPCPLHRSNQIFDIFQQCTKLLSNKEFVLPLKREAMFLRGYQINITVYCTKEALVGVGIGATISDMTRITSNRSLIGGILRCHLTTHIKRFECVQIQDLHITLYLTVLREKTKWLQEPYFNW